MTSQERSALVKLGEEYMSTVSSDYPTSCAINILAVKASGVISSREEAQTWAGGCLVRAGHVGGPATSGAAGDAGDAGTEGA